MNRSVGILTPSEWIGEVDKHLSIKLGPLWRRQSRVVRYGLDPHQVSHPATVQKYVRKLLMSMEAGDIIVLEPCYYTGNPFPSDSTAVRRIKDLDDFRRKIGTILEANEVDLISERSTYLSSRWEPNRISANELRSWLAQFQRFGDFEWVGRGVLAGLECYSTEELVSSLGLQDFSEGSWVCYNSPDGRDLESANPLVHAASKKFPRLAPYRIDDVYDLPCDRSSVVVEDCSISGQQFIDMCGKRLDPGRNLEIGGHLRFSVISNGAQIRIEKFLFDAGIHNLILDTKHCIKVDTITSEGCRAMMAGEFYCPNNKTPIKSSFVRKGILDDVSLWGTYDRAKSATRFLNNIGSQLYRIHSSRVRGANHSKKWLHQAGLGAGGYGLAIVLARSVPKSSLPVLWGKGCVKWNGMEVHWEPLFHH